MLETLVDLFVEEIESRTVVRLFPSPAQIARDLIDTLTDTEVIDLKKSLFRKDPWVEDREKNAFRTKLAQALTFKFLDMDSLTIRKYATDCEGLLMFVACRRLDPEFHKSL